MATPVDVATAAQLPAGKKAARVPYSSAAELAAAAEALGVPLTLTQGVRYCYSLPSIPPTQHCQVGRRNMTACLAHTGSGLRHDALQGLSVHQGSGVQRHAACQLCDTGAQDSALCNSTM